MRFIILAHARTGSNFLVNCLAQAPDVECYGEILKDDFGPIESFCKTLAEKTGISAEVWRARHGTNVPSFVYDGVFASDAEQKTGFKIFYNHARELGRKNIWNALIEDRELAVIHLTRNKLLDLMLSHLYAQRTKVWIVQTGDAGKNQDAESNDAADMVIKPGQCRRYFKTYVETRDRGRKAFEHHPVLEIDYAQLSEDPLTAVNGVLSFLGAEQLTALVEPTQKQSTRPASEKISNFDELKEEFAGTRWAAQFAE